MLYPTMHTTTTTTTTTRTRHKVRPCMYIHICMHIHVYILVGDTRHLHLQPGNPLPRSQVTGPHRQRPQCVVGAKVAHVLL